MDLFGRSSCFIATLCIGVGSVFGLDPDNAYGWSYEKNSPNADVCKTLDGLEDLTNGLVEFAEILETAVSPSLKTMNEVHQYIFCYPRSGRSRTDNYWLFQKNQKYFAHAAESFRIPYSVLVCLSMKESNYWDTDAHSKKDAIGLMQVTASTLPEINTIVNLRQEWVEKRLRSIEKDRDYWESSKLLKANRLLTEGGNIERTLRRHWRLKQAWDWYWLQSPSEDPLKDPNKSKLTLEDMRNPEIAVAAGSLVYIDKLLQLVDRTDLPLDSSLPSFSDDLYFIAGGSYNSGILPMLLSYKKDGKDFPPLQEWFEKNGIPDETYAHMVSIAACAEKDSWRAMTSIPITPSLSKEQLQACKQEFEDQQFGMKSVLDFYLKWNEPAS